MGGALTRHAALLIAAASTSAVASGLAGARDAPTAAAEFDALYAAIRDHHVAREPAREALRALLPRLAADFYAHGGTDAPRDAWRFPVEGYGPESIGGTGGSGYRPAGYDWFVAFDKGHPGHDIFILDRNQDEIDDRTGAPVNVLSISSGIVVAYAPDWTPGNQFRGGRYTNVYDPSQRALFYYAHQRSVLVKPGDIISPGQVIGTVGRSGRNASAPRSPTHLHVMFLTIDGGDYPRPRDIYRDLLRIGRRHA